MRIAQVSPLHESVPPRGYGGTERVVAYLTEELVRMGHDVTLFASGDSQTSARLVPIVARSLRTDPLSVDALAHHIVMVEHVLRSAASFDIVHFHIDYMHFPLSRRLALPNVTTLHGRLDIPDLQPLYDEFSDMPVVSISNAQRKPLLQANWVGTVPHGLPNDLFPLQHAPDGYLLFLGRISREKRVDRAIEIARRLGWPLRVAAKIDAADRRYFEQEIEPLFTQPFVEFLGEVDGPEKAALIGGARALLFPIDWQEPFGLVMIESMACGTPVVAWRGGSVEEVVTPGQTGFIVDSLDEAVDAVRRAVQLDRRRVRAGFEARFTAPRMARDYVAIYESTVAAPREDTRRRAIAG
jgi:glycosyltransferase involved in cell wall biosynthesis